MRGESRIIRFPQPQKPLPFAPDTFYPLSCKKEMPTCGLYTSRAQKVPPKCHSSTPPPMAGREGVEHHEAAPFYPAYLHSQSQQGAHLHLSNIHHFCMGPAPSHEVAEGKSTCLFQRENQRLWEKQRLWENKVQKGGRS